MSQYRPPKSSPRYESLDAWRGIACLMVVVYHATSFTTGNAALSPPSISSWLLVLALAGEKGVVLFFVISGYCISAAVDASARRQMPFADFCLRRLRRIFPPYWAMFALAAVLAAAAHRYGGGRFFWEVPKDGLSGLTHPANLSGAQWLGNLTLSEIWFSSHVLGRAPRVLEGMGHAWTLALEEQFYFVCALLLLLSGRRMSRFFAGALAVSLVTLVTASPALQPAFGGLFLAGGWIVFACGVAVYFDRAYASQRQRLIVRGGLMALLALGLSKLAWEVIIAAAFALALIALQRWDTRWACARVPRLAWWSGTRCYSLYLVHWPITRPLSRLLFEYGVRSPSGALLVTLPICLALSLLSAWIFHSAIERRFLNRPDSASASRGLIPRPASGTALVELSTQQG